MGADAFAARPAASVSTASIKKRVSVSGGRPDAVVWCFRPVVIEALIADAKDTGGTTTKKTNASDGNSSAQDAIDSTATDTYPGGKVDFSSIRDMAKTSGAKFPELVAAQWALESDWGNKPSGKNNYFGIKAGPGESSSNKPTWEVINGKKVDTAADFKNFDTPSGSVNELVNRWYKDYDNYKGVNRANSASEAADLLIVEKYATDPEYANKLRDILKGQGY